MVRKCKRLKGAVCDGPRIQGEVVGRVPIRLDGCGIDNAVGVRSVASVSSSQQSVIDCGTAEALKEWIEKGIKPAVGSTGGRFSWLKNAANYPCRTRKNK